VDVHRTLRRAGMAGPAKAVSSPDAEKSRALPERLQVSKRLSFAGAREHYLYRLWCVKGWWAEDRRGDSF
jgi:hypothetical protein